VTDERKDEDASSLQEIADRKLGGLRAPVTPAGPTLGPTPKSPEPVPGPETIPGDDTPP
jgi:hypothetical protein